MGGCEAKMECRVGDCEVVQWVLITSVEAASTAYSLFKKKFVEKV